MSIFLVSLCFIIGYIFIVLEHPLKIHKTASALLCAIVCWTLYTLTGSTPVETVTEQLYESISEAVGIVLFLICAMTIVETIDAHKGFRIVANFIRGGNKLVVLWIISGLTFFLSSILDNLTTSIVMLSIILKLPLSKHEKRLFLAMVIIAANAGGAWTPMGDVTTTMLWIANKISAINIIKALILPSLVCLLLPLLVITWSLSKDKTNMHLAPPEPEVSEDPENPKQEKFMLIFGIFLLMMVPVFKTFTHLPPFVGMIGAMSIFWITTQLIHRRGNAALRVESLISRIDLASALFFLGILLCVGSLQFTGILNTCASWLLAHISNLDIIAVLIGMISSVIDNVPVVAVSMGMFPELPMDHKFWEFVAYTAGTGGSLLVIGSAAGIAIMNPAKLDFFWYLKHVTLLALLGYLGGAGVYLLQYMLLN